MSNDCEKQETIGLRHIFVGMFFAIVVGVIADSAAHLIAIYETSYKSISALDATFFAPLIHLILALTVVCASWTEWSQEATGRRRNPLRKVFSLPFLVMILDISLVMLYYFLARAVEIRQVPNAIDGRTVIIDTPGAEKETFWLIIIFFVYLVWDFMVDVIGPKQKAVDNQQKAWRVHGSDMIVGCFASVICIGLSLWLFLLIPEQDTVTGVLFTDAALLSLVLFFRLLKSFEVHLAKFLPVRDAEHYTAREEGIKLASFFVIFLIPVIVAICWRYW